MARVPYVAADLAEPAEVVAAVRKRRGGKLIALDRMLLHSPPLAAGWNTYLGAVRTGLELDARLREVAMCAVAVINGAEYEFQQHAPVFVAAGGTDAQVQALRDPDRAVSDAALFSETERAALALTIEMTRNVKVRDETFERAHALLGVRQTVELVATIATYNMVSRFLVALGVEPE